MKIKTNILSIVLLFLVNLVFGQQMTFTAQKINVSGRIITISSLNDSAHVAGVLRSGDSDKNFIYDNKYVKTVPFLAGYDRTGGISINNKGQAGGSFSSSDTEKDPWVKGYLYNEGNLTGIGTLGGNHTQITGINNSGALSGYSGVADPFPYHAILYENGVLKDLGTIAHNFSRGFDINDSNHVVGWSNVVSGENNIYHAFIYRNNKMEDIGTLPGDDVSIAWAVNDSDYVVGQSTGTSTRAFVWYGSGSPIALPTLPGTTSSNVTDINNNNIMIGNCITNSGITIIPTVWINGNVYPINDLIDPGSGVTISEIKTINNNNNQIVGSSFNSSDGSSNFYILSPKNADFIVNITGDESDFDLNDEVADVDPDTPGDQTTLRAAIQQANYNSGKDKIGFNISGTPNPVIQVNSALPAITESVIINGYSPTYEKIEISGANAGVNANGLVIQVNDCNVKGLVIHSFDGSGIVIQNGSKNELYGNVIGTDKNSSAGKGNGKNGISIINGSDNIIGESTSEDLNVIAGNAGSGVFITGNSASGNWVKSNYIGTDTLGVDELGNGNAGIEIVDAGEGNRIGIGLEKSAKLKSATGVSIALNFGNIITKGLNSILIRNTIMTEIAGNTLGLFKSPHSETYKPLGSLLEGIKIENSKSTTISDIVAGAMGSHGIRITGPESKYNKIFNVLIGTDPNGSEGMGCEGSGICIDSLASENTLGGCDSLIRLVANQKYALQVINSTLNKIHGVSAGIIRNLKSSNLTKSATINLNLGNMLGGMHFLNAAKNIVGDSCAQNIITSNLGPGMIFEGESILNNIRANIIGTDESGSENIGNKGDGMVFMNGANKNTIGGLKSAFANISVSNQGNGFSFLNTFANNMKGNMSGVFGEMNSPLKKLGNQNAGVLVKNSREMVIHFGFFGGNRYGIRISGESSISNNLSKIFAGTDIMGSQNLGNSKFGILIDSLANNNKLGGKGKDSTVVVAGNQEVGLYLLQAKQNRIFNTMSGMMQKLHETQMSVVKNLGDGVVIEDSQENWFGDPEMPNMVGGNAGSGVVVKGLGSLGNKILASYFGTDTLGQSGLGNLLNGILITGGANQNTIGGLLSGEGIISVDNGNSGMMVSGQFTKGNTISGLVSGMFQRKKESEKKALGNKIGMLIENARENNIKNSIFAANRQEGFIITGQKAAFNKIASSHFGTDSLLAQSLGNLHGLLIKDKAHNNFIGGDGQNIFSGNKNWGVIVKNANDNRIFNNIVGNINGATIPIKNLIGGIKIENSTGNSIGRALNGLDGLVKNIGNFVSGHDSAGVAIINSPETQVTGNEIIQNKVGVLVKMDSTLKSIIQKMYIINNQIVENLRAFEGTNTEVYIAGNQIIDNTGLATGIHLFNSSGVIKGNLISGDAGDGIALEDGSNPVVIKNNIIGNAGFGVRNFDSSSIINTTQNWWGDTNGPSGSGPGSGDKVSDGINYSNWRTSMISFAAFAENDTIFLLPETTDTVEVYLANFQSEPGNVEINFADNMNWITDKTSSSIEFSEKYTGAVVPMYVSVPPGTNSNQTNTVVVHSSSKTGTDFATTDTIYLSVYEPMLVELSLLTDTVFVATGGTYQFSAIGYDQEGNVLTATGNWEANGGKIDNTGLFTAGTSTGDFYVKVTDNVSQLTDSAVIIISESTFANKDGLGDYKLYQNYPNPFSSATTIKYSIPFESKISVRIFTINGVIVKEFLSTQPSGEHIFDWDASESSAGMYFYSINAMEINGNHSFRDVKKMSVLKK